MKKALKTMVRVLVLTLLLSMSMSTVTEAAVAKPKVVYNKAVKCYNNRNFEKARKYFGKMAKNAHEASVKKMSPAIKRAYLQVLNSYVSTYGLESTFGKRVDGYYLTDIDKDKKPEMIVEIQSSEADSTGYVYSYINGRATQLGTVHTGHTGLHYDPRGNGMTAVYGQQGHESVSTVKISSGRIVTEKWKVERQLGIWDEYMNFPLLLDDHIRYTSGSAHLDYSPLQ